MSQFKEGLTLSFLANGSLADKEYHIVKRSSGENDIVLSSAASDKHVGVLSDDAADAEGVMVWAGGAPKVKLGGTVAIGDWLTSDANGKAIATTSAGNECIGQALEAGVENDVIQFRFERIRY